MADAADGFRNRREKMGYTGDWFGKFLIASYSWLVNDDLCL